VSREADSYPGFQYEAMVDINRFYELVRWRSYVKVIVPPYWREGERSRLIREPYDPYYAPIVRDYCFQCVICIGDGGVDIFHVRGDERDINEVGRIAMSLQRQPIRRGSMPPLKIYESEPFNPDAYEQMVEPVFGRTIKVPKRKVVEPPCEPTGRPVSFDD